ncbi:MAG: hypothetical protein V4509_01695 [Patescibacteria group bacterium]
MSNTNNEPKVFFCQGYSGTVKAGVTIHGIDYVFDLDWLKAYLEKQIDSKGFTTGITGKQKLPRITINS